MGDTTPNVERYSSQFSILSAGARLNSVTLGVTQTASARVLAIRRHA